jgi:hypothetical protein
MTQADIRTLKENDGEAIEIRCRNGEVMKARVVLVSESEGDVIYRLISTNRPEQYSDRQSGATELARFEDIETISPVRGGS